MNDSGRERLRQIFLVDYDKLKRRLTRRLGSADHAKDVLQDTWLRLEAPLPIGPVDRPFPYLLRIAYNIAAKREKREPNTVTLDEARAALDLIQDVPDPARIFEARAELAALRQALAELSPRRREILLASRADGVSLRNIALHLGVSQRLVEIELKQALIHCGLRLGRTIIQRFGPRAILGSNNQETNIDEAMDT